MDFEYQLGRVRLVAAWRRAAEERDVVTHLQTLGSPPFP